MKTIKKAKLASTFIGLVFFLFAFTYTNAQDLTNKKSDLNKTETQFNEDILWSVKAYRPDDNLLKIKAIVPKNKNIAFKINIANISGVNITI